MIKPKDEWPFDNEYSDFVVSNEGFKTRVWDYDHFFKENYRVLAERGFARHLFLVKEVFIDGHVFNFL